MKLLTTFLMVLLLMTGRQALVGESLPGDSCCAADCQCAPSEHQTCLESCPSSPLDEAPQVVAVNVSQDSVIKKWRAELPFLYTLVDKPVELNGAGSSPPHMMGPRHVQRHFHILQI